MAKQQATLNQTDLSNLKALIRQELSEEIAIQLEEKLDEKLGFLPTKDEFFSKVDQVLGEVQKMREDFAAHLSTHDRITEDTSRLKTQVNHLYQTFEIKDPTKVVVSY